ncbi:lysophospholipid acyltransferase family protein [Carboxylicivirga sp. N1Y90]|uniref:lysophospholipid acyltransferase family protein n=1 Tax=Carboxylicivirga fragile TaxID=3417571 RepID=UPI003D343DAD|nr:lysophospholipid acyltransferase family protein [Marinilabiliaceae bacterium N1Y90]
MNLLLAALFYFFAGLIGIMPFWLIYQFSNFASFVLGKGIKYRRKVILENLQQTFPDKPKQWIDETISKTYLNLSDNLLESFKSFTMLKSSIRKRHKIVNPELLDKYIKNKQSVIGVTAHYNNWEWGSLSAGLQTNYNYIAFYKPLSNSIINKTLKNSRSKCGTKLASIANTSSTFESYKNEPHIYLMAADQSPSGTQIKNALWFDFLGRDTAFLHGIEKHSRNNNFPVVYIDIQRIKRGYYEVTLQELCDNPSELTDGEITERYVRKLEDVISKKPENWLWSHRRWKHKRNKGE